MVIGNGLIGKAFDSFRQNDKFIIFASGVSNSQCKDNKEYEREKYLLLDVIEQLKEEQFLIYFSTCSILDEELRNSEYIQHKLKQESLLLESKKNSIIFRLPNVIGETKNPNTIFNFLVNKINNEEKIELWENAERNFLDIEDIVYFLNLFLKNVNSYNHTILNLASPSNTKILSLVVYIEQILEKRAKKEIIFGKGGKYNIPTNELSSLLNSQNYKFKNIIDIIKKYINKIL